VAARAKGRAQPPGQTLGTCIDQTLSRVIGPFGRNSMKKACRIDSAKGRPMMGRGWPLTRPA
jgi:hypothetical protein